MKKSIIILALFVTLLPIPSMAQSITPSPPAQADAITIIRNNANLDYPQGIIFRLSASSQAEIKKVLLHYKTSGLSCQDEETSQLMEFDPAKAVELSWKLEFERSGVIPPGSQLQWQWEIEDTAGNTLLTEQQTLLVNDQRHVWKHLTQDQITLQWFQGDQSFGQSLLSSAQSGLRRLDENTGVHLNVPIWISVYPTSEEMREAAVHTQQWAGAVAFTSYNSILIGVPISELNWAREAIPHELAHLVFEVLTFNCKGISLPLWLNEGFAMQVEWPLSQEEQEEITDALARDELPLLSSLERIFPADSEQAVRSYTHSAMVVHYLIEKFGKEKLTNLINTIQSGKTFNEALETIYRLDTNHLDASWRNSMGFYTQVRPKNKKNAATQTAVPTLPLWTPLVKPSPTLTNSPSPSPTKTNPPKPTITNTPEEPFSDETQMEETVSSVSPTTTTGGHSTPGSPWLLAGAAFLLLVITGVVLFKLKQRR